MLFAQGAKAQTNLQVFYDFEREHVTTTLEMFKGDNWGNTFFFVDYDYNFRNADNKVTAPSATYFEIARCLNFWGNSALAPLSLQVEYNGGLGIGYPINNAWLVGADYFLHSADFSNTLNLKALYKKNVGGEGTPIQFTAVWGMQNLFGVNGLSFSGFFDIWGNKMTALKKGSTTELATTNWTIISEPQLWYNVGQFFGCENLNVGGEVEISNNFAANGFYVRPCLGVKWAF